MLLLKVGVSPTDAGRNYAETLTELAGSVGTMLAPIVIVIVIVIAVPVLVVSLLVGVRPSRISARWRWRVVGILLVLSVGQFLGREVVSARRGPCGGDISAIRSTPRVLRIIGPHPPPTKHLVYLGTGDRDRVLLDCSSDPRAVYLLPSGEYEVVTAGY